MWKLIYKQQQAFFFLFVCGCVDWLKQFSLLCVIWSSSFLSLQVEFTSVARVYFLATKGQV